ncbi:hypothetical protein DU473_06675 [Campylobacter novaezeelandiae]|uniref:Uncharacterized protein n=1 Tax=Campylobacter novaezeelandiae TaxID=2267891 RepID=A0A4Q9JT58_9BACT|nr:hypothetical protein [Campylobacter novaezeelandiae]TBR79831.1 hypothetical protein DU473_06675 [Campylobacter novaezeelandiae]
MSYLSCSVENSHCEYEKYLENQDNEMKQEELRSGKSFKILYEDFDNFFLTLNNLNKDDEFLTSLSAYGDEFINDCFNLLENLKTFKNKYEKLY